jgi:hypothetical protein
LRIAAQSCRDQAARKAPATGCGWGGELLHALSKAIIKATTNIGRRRRDALMPSKRMQFPGASGGKG